MTMGDPLMRYESYACGVKRLLLFAGLWPGRVTSSYFKHFVIIHMITSIMTSFAIMNFVISHAQNLGLVTKGLGTAVSFFTMILKVIVFSINRKLLMELHEILETDFHKDLADPKLRSVLLSPLKFFYRPTLSLTLSTWGIVFIYFCTPPISIIVNWSYGASEIRYRLPFPSQYPWNVTGNSFLYWAHYFMEILAGCALAGVTTATDALFGFYIFQMSSQLRTLSYRMANLKSTDDYRFVMKECAIRYQTLSHCRNSLERIYGPIILWLLMTSAINICAHIFQMSQITIDKAVLVMLFIIMKLMQTLLYAWYGLFLTTESEGFRDSIYCSGWPGSVNRSFMTNVFVMLMYKPLTLTACHFSVISLDMFIAVTNTALSYFLLLRTLEEGK